MSFTCFDGTWPHSYKPLLGKLLHAWWYWSRQWVSHDCWFTQRYTCYHPLIGRKQLWVQKQTLFPTEQMTAKLVRWQKPSLQLVKSFYCSTLLSDSKMMERDGTVEPVISHCLLSTISEMKISCYFDGIWTALLCWCKYSEISVG